MTNTNLLQAMGRIDPRLIADAAPDIPQKKSTNKTWVKWASLAACFCFVITLGIYFILNNPFIDTPGGDNIQTPAKIHGAWFNDFFYEEMANEVYHSIYPELNSIVEKTAVGNKYNIDASCLGTYLGVFPAIEWLDLPEGKAYRWKAYPNYDSIIIVERNGKYAFYVTEGNAILNNENNDANIVLEKLGLPESAVSFIIGDSTSIPNYDTTAISTISSILSDKKIYEEFSNVEKQKWQTWYDENGDVGVRYENGEVVFANSEIRTEYGVFYGSTIHTIWISTNNGFNIRVLYDPEYNYISICNNNYYLSDEECLNISLAFNIQ